MIVDSSALMAILCGEPEADLFIDLMLTNKRSRMAAGTWLELSAVLTRSRRAALFAVLDGVVSRFQLRIAETTVSQAQIGHAACRRYGIGSGHPAKLKLGDCFSYALAIEADEPLLFKGNDFVHTDVKRAA